jgi:serine/threonine-protein kinase
MSDTTIIASRYRVIRELGRGGMGVVYVVEHTRTGDQVALKLLYGQGARDPGTIERFRREARASARIKSEHVVKVIDADVAPELENAPFLVMELLNGNDLEKQIETRGAMPPQEVIHYLSQAARALDKSHAMSIVHRDLKPENLFVHQREDGSTILKILDFGISKVVGGEAADMTGAGMTSTGSVMGTPLYMAPEQARGRVNEIGPATDVWAMGLIALRLLTGEIYWRANTVAELMVQILAEPMAPPSQRWHFLPPAFDTWFARSCERDPKQRWPSVGQQIEALGAVFGIRASAVPSTDGSVRWPPGASQQAGLAVPTGAAAGLVGVATTGATAQTANEATATAAKRSGALAPVVAGISVLLLVLAGGATTVWLVKGRSAASHVSGDPSTSASIAAATAPPPPVSGTAASALTGLPTTDPSAPSSASSLVDAGLVGAAADGGHKTPSHHSQPPAKSQPTGQPAAPPQPAPPQPPPAPKATTYNPAAP